MLKNTKFTSLVTLSLFVICLILSHVYPVPGAPLSIDEIGDAVSVSLTKLDGNVTFTQIDTFTVEVTGKLNKGIEKNEPSN